MAGRRKGGNTPATEVKFRHNIVKVAVDPQRDAMTSLYMYYVYKNKMKKQCILFLNFVRLVILISDL